MLFGKISFFQLLEYFLRWFPAIILVVVLVSFCMFFILDFPKYQHAAGAKHWPTAEATITNSNLSQEITSSDRVIKGLTTTLHSANIEYDYVVNGTKYHSSGISIAGWGNCKTLNGIDECQELIDKFPKGFIAKAYYDPSQPSFSILMPGVDSITIFSSSLGIGALILLLGVNLYIFSLIAFLLRSNPILGITLSTVITICCIVFSGAISPYCFAATGALLPKLLIPHDWLMS